MENGILIDNPGMREIGMSDSHAGLELTFSEIAQLAEDCKYRDCQHIDEHGCAVLEAIDNQELSLDSYENYLKLEKERFHFESTNLERKKKGKDLGKLIRNMKKEHRKY